MQDSNLIEFWSIIYPVASYYVNVIPEESAIFDFGRSLEVKGHL